MRLDPHQLHNARLIADGSWATQLRKRGLPTDEQAETANVDRPDLVAGLAEEYVAAGARFLTTNTFSANQYRLEQTRHGVAAVNRAGAEIAQRAAAGRDVHVVGSIGPSGKLLVVREAAEEDLARAFAEQAEALAAGGADAILLETFSEMAELAVAIQAVREACDLPLIASMSFDSGPQRTRTMMGAEAGEAARVLEDAGADIVGCNCGAGIGHVLPAVVALRSASKLPLWVKPNAGLPELERGEAVYRMTPEEFAAEIPTLFEAGANVVGGCCGTGPEHIRRAVAATH